MTSKTRLQIAFDQKEPDRVPVHVSFVPEVLDRLRVKYGMKEGSESTDAGVVSNIDYSVDTHLGHDMLILNMGMGPDITENSSQEKTHTPPNGQLHGRRCPTAQSSVMVTIPK